MWISDSFLGHNVVEIFAGDFPAITCSSLKHFFQLAGIHGFSQLLCDSSDVIKVDGSGAIIIKEIKNSIDSGLN
jgi:hypothetical protein